MYASYVIGLIFSVLVLKKSQCAAQSVDGLRQRGQYDVQSKISGSQCKDVLTYCDSVKENGGCVLPRYQRDCKMTCGICSQETQLIVRENKECRDIGNVQFCARACHQKKSKHLKLYYARKYCRKTCGYCSRLKKKVENTCVDRPICKRLTTFYKIENCWRLPHTLRKRALRKCPKLCGLCSPITEKPPVPTTTLLNGVAAEKLKLTEAPRPPHPPVDDGESDERPRGGVFYIYTKYLSL